MILRRPLLAALALAAFVVVPGAEAREQSWQVVGSSAQGGVAFVAHNDGHRVWSTDFHFVTRCGTTHIPGRLVWGESESSFSYRSRDGRVRMYTYVFTGPRGGGYGWVSDRRDNGCRSGKVKFRLRRG